MRPSKTSLPSAAASQPASWMKPVFLLEISLFFIIAAFAWEQWTDARRELAIRTREEKLKREANDELAKENENSVQFLTKYTNDPDFRMRVARQRLGYAVDGEFIVRLQPAARTQEPMETSSKQGK